MPNAKLTYNEKEAIKELEGKENARDVAKKYGVSHTTIYTIWNNELSKAVNFNLLQYETLVGIIKKMIPPFVENRLKVSFDGKETDIMSELVKEVMK